jgi:uncharacterized protein (TIGR02996 family)
MRDAELFEEARRATTDDAPRLVLADALMERGDPLGTFIRVQCERARTPPGLADAALEQQERELLEAHGDEWKSGLPPGGYTFVRGFIERVVCSVDTWLREHQAIRARTAVASLSVWGWQRGAELAAADALEGIRSLQLDFQIHEPDAVTLFGNPAVRALKKLFLRGGWIGDDAARAMAASPHLGRLEEAVVESVMGKQLSHVGVAALFDAPALAGCDLRLDASVSDETVAHLATTGTLSRRRDWHAARWSITAAAVPTLVAAAPRLLALPCHRIGDDGGRSAAAASSVEALEITGVIEEYGDRTLYLGDPGLAALCSSPALDALRSFTFGFGDATTEEGTRAIWSAPWLPALRELDLRCWLDAAALADAARAGRLDALELLRVHGEGDAIEVLAEVPLPRLRRLELQGWYELSDTIKARLRDRLGTIAIFDCPDNRWSPIVSVSSQAK